MTAKVSGNSGDLTPKKYTFEDLGIKEGSPEASIFQKIDKEDGKEDGFLTTTQLDAYNRMQEGYCMYDFDKNNDFSGSDVLYYKEKVRDELREINCLFPKLRRAIAPQKNTKKSQ